MSNILKCGAFLVYKPEDSWLSITAISYALERLWHIATQESAYAGPPIITFQACSPQQPYNLLTLPDHSLQYVPLLKLLPSGGSLSLDTDRIPVLFPVGTETNLLVEQREDKTIHFNIDLAATIFFMLSRWEETIIPARDSHDRFPAAASVAYRQGFLDRPIVDEYAMILREWLHELVPGWKAPKSQFRVFLSHDMDHPILWRSFGQAMRTSAGDIIKRRKLNKAYQSLTGYIHTKLDWNCDSHVIAWRKLMQLSEQHSLHSAFYFMASSGGHRDEGYDPRRIPYQTMIYETLERGHEVGFHPGYSTYNDFRRFSEEKSRLEETLNNQIRGGRQHYLRFRVPDTWRYWEAAGLKYDSTLGYADSAGFRCGTCHSFPIYDCIQDKQLNIFEIPLIVQDGTLKDTEYMSLQVDDGKQLIIRLASRCKAVGGTFTLLWHSSSLHGPWLPWIQMYSEVLQHLENLNSSS